MKRLLLHLVVLFSLLLSLAVAAAWIRSYSYVDRFRRRTFTLSGSDSVLREWTIATRAGQVDFYISRLASRSPTPPPIPTGSSWKHTSDSIDPSVPPWRYTPSNHKSDMSERVTRGFNAWFISYGNMRWQSDYGDESFAGRSHSLIVPHWLLILLLMILPAVHVYRDARARRQRRRLAAGQCPQCGYDLRASPERCPECGTIAKAPA